MDTLWPDFGRDALLKALAKLRRAANAASARSIRKPWRERASIIPASDHAPGYRAIRWNMDWITRPLFGIVLAVIAMLAVVLRRRICFASLAVADRPCRRRGMASHGGQASRIAAIEADLLTALTVALAVAGAGAGRAWLVRPCCWWRRARLGGVLLAMRSGQIPLWQAAGRGLSRPAGSGAGGACACFRRTARWSIIGLFVIVWATDTGALIFGNLIGGPRLAPKLSPSKTWAGTIGGSVTAAVVFGALHRCFLGGSLAIAALFALGLQRRRPCRRSVRKSFVKRRFGLKNSGGLIPGHGGVLDRIDSTLAASVVMALLVFAVPFQSPVRGRIMKPIAATRAFDELPPLDDVLGAQRHGAGLDRLDRRQHAGCDRPCPQSLWRAMPFRSTALTARRQCRRC